MKADYVIEQLRKKIFDRCEFSVHNVFFFAPDIESDVISLTKKDYLVEYEIKTSRPDFLADRRKSKWKFYKFNYNKAPKYFYYVLPKNTAKIEELPDFAGLIEYYETAEGLEFEKVKNPEILNKLKATEEEKYSLLKKLYYKSLSVQFNYEVHKK